VFACFGWKIRSVLAVLVVCENQELLLEVTHSLLVVHEWCPAAFMEEPATTTELRFDVSVKD